jgi:glycosyltransferase involved in cell wall biosynthesis
MHPTTPARLHVLFLNANAGLGADSAVHLSLARTLDRSKVRVSAATSRADTAAGDAFAHVPNITHLSLDLGRQIGQGHGLARATAFVDNLAAAGSLRSLANWCRANQVDLVHVTERPRQSLFGLLLARTAGCACLIHAHISFYPHDATQFATWRLRQADAVVGVSRFTAGTYQRLAGLAADRVFAVHNAVDGATFRPDANRAGRLAMRTRLGIPADAPVVGCIARLMRWKGQENLLDAFANVRRTLPRARLVLAGTSADVAPDGRGDYRDYLLRHIAELGLDDAVILAGFLPQATMPQLYAALDVVAHPSPEEPFGLAVAEAMACARPVIAIDGGGLPEIIRSGIDGVLVPAGQPPALAEAITRVLTDHPLASELAAAGRRRVLEAFTPEIQAGAMVRVYQAVVARRRRLATADYASV